MKRRVSTILLVLVLLLVLCACDKEKAAKEQTETAQTVGNTVQEASVSETGGIKPRPKESMEVEITDPTYVYLPEDTTEDENLIFTQWTAEQSDGTQLEEPVAEYQDVTQVENAVAIPSVYGKAGETIRAQVRICGQVDLCAFDLRVNYDPQLLKYIGCQNADEALLVNGDAESGTVMMNFLQIVDLEKALNVCDLQFEVLTDLDCDTPLDIEVVEAVSLDENGQIEFCNYSTLQAQVHLNESDE